MHSEEPHKNDTSPDETLRHISQSKIAKGEYDVFLCYNGEDRRSVRDIGNQLLDRGIAVWLDIWELPPGRPWQREIERLIPAIPSAAVFVGRAGVGPWQQMEIEALLRQFVNRGCPVIPLLLPNATTKPELPLFLEGMTWVDFRKPEQHEIDEDEEPLDLLIWGISGQRVQKYPKPDLVNPQSIMPGPSSSSIVAAKDKTSKNVLIASLGESPVVVSVMYDLLTKKQHLKIDRVLILMPDDEYVRRSYQLVQKGLADICNDIQCELLPFEDANSWVNVCIFLQRLYKLLDTSQAKGEGVYLSSAGGRKSMAALMAWVVPFFSCVKHLYHVIDKDERHFLSLEDIRMNLSPFERSRVMHPDLENLILVDIPFEKDRQVSQKLITRLLSATNEDFNRMQYEEAETATLLQAVTQPGKILDVLLTRPVVEQFRAMCTNDVHRAIELKSCFERMGFMPKLQSGSFDAHKLARSPETLHFFKDSQTSLRLVFYTRPKDIAAGSEDVVTQVVVCALEAGANGEYRTLKKIATSPDFSPVPEYRIDELPPIPYTAPADSILIVPLGKTPMVATQLYMLLEYQECRTIRSVYLVYPERAIEINNAAKIVKNALQEWSGIPCKYVHVPGLEDIDSENACKLYQTTLEETIADVRKQYPDYKIDLALSGGRKGMTAMTIFAAQKQHISFVYHTLVVDDQLSRKIDDETTVEALNDLSRKERNNRLFLQDYKDEGPYAKFALFKVPVFSQEQSEIENGYSTTTYNQGYELKEQSLHVDVLLVTVTDVEAQAVITSFPTAKLCHLGDQAYHDLGILAGARIFMVQSEMGSGGQSGSILTIQEAIDVLHPSAIIMVGIAFGIDQKKRHIGDILVSRQLLPYDLQRVGTDSAGKMVVTLRADRPSASPKMLTIFRAAAKYWQAPPKVQFGPVLSGDKLVDNQDYRDQLVGLNPEAIGGEMEGTGLYATAQRKKVDWILVKAVCDWADGQKTQQDEGQRQKDAAENAVRFLLYVISKGGFGSPNA